MSPLRLFAAAPAGVLAVCLALSASAQTPPPSARPPPGDRAAYDTARRDHMRERMTEHRAKMLADWTQILKLTPAQAQGLQAAMTPPTRGEHAKRGDRGQECRAPDSHADETTLQRLDRMQARMAEREGRMRAHLAAMRSFYLSLGPDQQRSFDGLVRLTHGGMHGRHGMGGHGMGRGGWETGAPGGGPGMRHGPPPPPAGE